MDNQVSGRAYYGAGAGGSLLSGQTSVRSAGGRLITIVRVRPHSPTTQLLCLMKLTASGSNDATPGVRS